MAVLFVLPGPVCAQTNFALEIRCHRDPSPTLPGQSKVFILESIREADVTGIFQAGAKIEMVDTRPVDCTHAHRAGSPVDVDFAALQHTRPLLLQVWRTHGARDHLENRPFAIVAAQKCLRIQPARRIDDRGDFGVIDWTSWKQHAILSTPDNLAVLYDYGAKRSSPALLHRLERQSRRFFHEIAGHRILP